MLWHKQLSMRVHATLADAPCRLRTPPWTVFLCQRAKITSGFLMQYPLVHMSWLCVPTRLYGAGMAMPVLAQRG